MLRTYKSKIEKNRITEEEMMGAVSEVEEKGVIVRSTAKAYGIENTYLERIVVKFKNAEVDEFQHAHLVIENFLVKLNKMS